ncbi:MAG: HypC/HybG/HupF family hydrogenase formation chaperone [candidate division Zixibacteria bacterium]|nr:HypC/HybG/HupF family hydrogenase formation chaperone [candidate division Zixibacteria bacterium]
MCLAVPGKLIELIDNDELMPVGKVDFGGVARDVILAYVPDAKIGDYVNVHAGFAISIIDAEEAEQILQCFQQLEDIAE